MLNFYSIGMAVMAYKKVQNKFTLLLLVVTFFFLVAGDLTVYAQSSSFRISVDDKPLETVPIQKDGTLFVPMREIFEGLRAEVVYRTDTGTIVVRYKEKSLSLRVGSRAVISNGKQLTLTHAPFIQNSKVYVPLRGVSQLLGAEVELSATDRSVNIRSVSIDLIELTALPITNNQGSSLVLEHDGSLRLKWWYKDASPYERYTGGVYPNKQLLIQGFNEGFVVDSKGKRVFGPSTTIRQQPLLVDLIKVGSGYTVQFDLQGKSYKWKGIPLYIGDRSIFSEYKEGVYSYHGPLYLDRNENLIVVTDDGLAAYGPSGERLWVRSAWVEEGRKWSPLDDLFYIKGDDSGRIYLFYGQEVLALAPGGSLLAVLPGGAWATSVLDDGSLLWRGGLYRWEGDKLVKLTQPSGGGGTGDNVMDINDSYFVKKSPINNAELWRYRIGQAEKTRGFSLDYDSLIADEVGRAYISTNGGTVHALDNTGHLRFILRVDNAYGSAAEIIPLSKEEVVIMVGNIVLSLETVQAGT